jgi:hypothetical protein
MITRRAGVCRVRQASPLRNTVADDAGALLVRSGLVSSDALEDARARVESLGGTLGEQLVIGGAITDDDLTDFYCTRLLVPQVNPNALARLTPKIVAAIPSDMAIELRAIPVSYDADNNLTVAMSDPSDRHAVDEIAFFTGVYVVRAVATQMQVAWCLAHYYGHVTALGQRLLRTDGAPAKAPSAQRIPRTKGLTGKVNATRHRAIAPVTGPVDVIRPNSGELDLQPLAKDAASIAKPGAPAANPAASIAKPGAPAANPASNPASIATPGAPASSPASVATPGAPAASPASVAKPGAPAASPVSIATPGAPAASAAGSMAKAPSPPIGAASTAGSTARAPSPPIGAANAAGSTARAPASPIGAASVAGSTARAPSPPIGAASAAGSTARAPSSPIGAASVAGSTARAPSSPIGAASAAGSTARAPSSPIGAASAIGQPVAPVAGLAAGAAVPVGVPAALPAKLPPPPAVGTPRSSPAGSPSTGLVGGPASQPVASSVVARPVASELPRPSPASTPAPSGPSAPGPVATSIVVPGLAAATPANRPAPASTPTIPGVGPGSSSTPTSTPVGTPTLPGVGVPPVAALAATAVDAVPAAGPGAADPAASADASGTTTASLASSGLPAFGPVPRAAPDAPTLPPSNAERTKQTTPPPEEPAEASGEASSDGAPEKSRARSVSGEIRVPVRRAPSIRPPLPAPDDDDDDEPLIVIERGADEDASGPRKAPVRRRMVKTNPPELRARAGEVDLKQTQDRAIDADEPRIVIDEDALAPPTARIDTRPSPRDTPPPLATIDVVDDPEVGGAVIHDRVPERDSQPILLDRPRATPDQFESTQPDDDDADTGEIVVMLDAKSLKHRPERRTVVGVPPAPVPSSPIPVRAYHEHDPAVPTAFDSQGTDRIAEPLEDATKLDVQPAPPGEDTASDLLAAPPSPASDDDTNPHVVAPPPGPAAPAAAHSPAAPAPSALPPLLESDDDDDLSGPRTSVMSAVELDEAIPDRTSEVLPGHLSWRVDYDPVDDGWGPPGTTIPPPLLGAIPGSEDDDEAIAAIPMPSIDSSPLMMVSPSLPSSGDATGGLVRAVEDAAARAIEVIRELERAQSRDQVVEVMIAHLAETHHRAGFFVTRHAQSKDAGELALFAMTPKPAVMPFATLRLDRPSTLQDVVGTRLPYRGPMHDDASRGFLISILGACPPEILLVPVAVRERVVGVLFGEHRQRQTFDDQLALAARAAGMALERILKARRS